MRSFSSSTRAYWLLALAELDDEVGPLAWLDVGASGGLNLRLDRYHYRYEPGGAVGLQEMCKRGNQAPHLLRAG